MQGLHGEATLVEAQRPLGIGSVQLVRKHWHEPIDVFGTAAAHHLQLALLAHCGVSEACFPDRWGPHRFEPIGEVFFLPARQAVHAKSDCRHQNSVVFNIDPASVEEWFGDGVEWTDRRLQGSLNIVNGNLRRLLFRIGEEIRNPGLAGETMVELLAGQTMIELFRHLTGIEEPRVFGGLSPWRLKLIDERLSTGGAPPSLSELAGLCGMSVRHLTRAFRASRGRAIGSYIADHRMDQAKRLLASGMCVKSVAYETGFTAPSNFAAAFLRAAGETPRQYQQRARRKGASSAVAVLQKIH
jgi:AraC family transcriptional regulator